MPGVPKLKPAAIWDRVLAGMPARQAIGLFLLFPAGIGATLGWYRAGYTADYPLAVSLFEWMANFVLLWIAFEIGSRLASFLMRPWTPPLWGVLILGGIAGVAISRPVRTAVRDFSARFVPDVQAEVSFPDGLVWEEYVFAYASVVAVPIIIWVVANYIYVQAFGVERFGHRRVPESKPEDGPKPLPIPDFVKQLAAGPNVEIHALQAEDHYLRVYTATSNELIRYRFSDAVGEVSHLPGLQVHRSFWVNKKAVANVRRNGRSYEIVLKGGLEVPVSRSFRYAVKESGLLGRTA
jgi:hypothetical protein